MRLSSALELFIYEYIHLRGLSSSTQENYEIAVSSFIKSCGDISIEELSISHILEWRRAMERTNKPGTIRVHLSKLKNIIHFTNKRGLSNFDLDNIPLPKVTHPLPKYLSAKEVSLMITAEPNKRNKAMLSMLFASGIRAQELCDLQKTDVHDYEVTIQQGKKGNTRIVFIDQRTKELIGQYLESRYDTADVLFYSAKHGKLDPATLNRLVRAAGENARLEKPVHTHMLRHSFATNLLRNNCNLRYIQEMMGHAFVSTTQIYTHVVKGDMYEAYQKAHQI